MSTRATVHFQYKGVTKAIVYKHSDGYPDGLGKDLEKFLDEVEENLSDTRFNDPQYLAAKFVVWQVKDYEKYYGLKNHFLDFFNVGIYLTDPSDIEYRYLLECSSYDKPTITVEEAHMFEDSPGNISLRYDILV